MRALLATLALATFLVLLGLAILAAARVQELARLARFRRRLAAAVDDPRETRAAAADARVTLEAERRRA